MSLVICAVLPAVEVMMTVMYADSRANVELLPQSDAAQAIIENTTANFSELTGKKDKQVTINWLSYCDAGVEDCTTDCEVTATAQIAAHCEDYALSMCQQTKGFTVAEKDLRNKKYETTELIALGLAKEAKALDEWWAEKAVEAVDNNAGVNVSTAFPSTYTVGTETYIPAPQWTPSMTGQFALTAKQNRFTSPFLLSGQNLYLSEWNTAMDVTNPEGQAAKKRSDVFKKYFDLFNVDAYNSPNKKTYMIQRGSLAFVTKSYYSTYTFANQFEAPGNVRIWSMDSPSLPGVKYDVHYEYTCVNNEYFHTFQLKTYGDIFINPLGCDQNNTGVLSFTCGVPE